MKLIHNYLQILPQYQNLYMAASQVNLALFQLVLASDFHINFRTDCLDSVDFSILNIELPLQNIWTQSYTASTITRLTLKLVTFPCSYPLLSRDGHIKEWVAVYLRSNWYIGRLLSKLSSQHCSCYVLDVYNKAYFEDMTNLTFVNEENKFTIVRKRSLLHIFQINATTDAGNIKDRDLDLIFIKVKAHVEDPYNELADELAKKRTDCNSPHRLSFNYRISDYQFCLHFEDTSIEQKLRDFIKIMGQVQSYSEWEDIHINEDTFIQCSIQYQ
ncbi:hypothetical protein GLOIN_2v1788498 [Rhizophagus clarus]|uniref:Uncharacterized protein n=1 Tax=Rhizophagus clarus TaxID=94130 RepID=A0A8H3LCY3_9GLOM|nr:hypothetical protein GLOIN_2v1788498 [Rhizophagus clarus]